LIITFVKKLKTNKKLESQIEKILKILSENLKHINLKIHKANTKKYGCG